MTGPLILPFNGKVPRIHKTAYIAPNATIIGDVVIGEHASVFYNVVLRGDLNRITIGDRTNIQDNCVLHVDADAPCTLGDDVTVGHHAMLHGCTIGNRVLVGMGSIVLDDAVVENEVVIGAGSLVPPRKRLKSGFLYMGSPAVAVRELTDAERAHFLYSAAHYVKLAADYLQP